VGTEWNDEDTHERWGLALKIVMTGELDVKINGTSVIIRGEGDTLIITTRSLMDSFRLRGFSVSTIALALRWLNQLGIGANLRIGERLSFEILPKPSFFLSLFSPAVRLSVVAPNST